MRRGTLLFAVGMASAVQAQWSATILAPAGIPNSAVYAVTPNYQAGSARLTGPNQSAVIWHGSPSNYDDLNPAGSNNSMIAGAHGNTQGGFAVFNSVAHAAMWQGSAASFVDLHPAGSTGSSVTAVYGGMQGGAAHVPRQHAALWSGSAATFLDINPIPGGTSAVYGMGPGQQVGSYDDGASNGRACTWAGTAASMVDLNGTFEASFAYGTDGVHQVGAAEITPGSRLHAIRWTGTPTSWIDLTPAGADSAEAYGVTGSFQTGFVYFGTTPFASVWSGSSQSWLNLHQFLPSGYMSSRAYSIVETPTQLIVGGYAVNTAGTEAHAVMWSMPVPEPATLAGVSFAALLFLGRRRRSLR